MPQFIAKDRRTNFCLDYDSVISRQAPSNLNGQSECMDGFCKIKNIKSDGSEEQNCYKVDTVNIAVNFLTKYCLKNESLALNDRLAYVLEDYCYNITLSAFFDI